MFGNLSSTSNSGISKRLLLVVGSVVLLLFDNRRSIVEEYSPCVTCVVFVTTQYTVQSLLVWMIWPPLYSQLWSNAVLPTQKPLVFERTIQPSTLFCLSVSHLERLCLSLPVLNFNSIVHTGIQKLQYKLRWRLNHLDISSKCDISHHKLVLINFSLFKCVKPGVSFV